MYPEVVQVEYIYPDTCTLLLGMLSNAGSSHSVSLLSHHNLCHSMRLAHRMSHSAGLSCAGMVQLYALDSLASFLVTPKVQLGVGADPVGWITSWLTPILADWFVSFESNNQKCARFSVVYGALRGNVTI